MANGKKSFMFYCDWRETFESLPDDKAGELIKHVLRYVNDENPQTDDILIKAVFANIKATLKRDLKKWEKIVERNRKNGALGGRPPGTQQNPENPVGYLGTQINPKKPDSDSDSDSVKEKEKNKPHIVPLSDFLAYAIENKPNVCKQAVELKYKAWSANGWKDGNNKPVKNWKTKLLNTLPFMAEVKNPKSHLKIDL